MKTILHFTLAVFALCSSLAWSEEAVKMNSVGTYSLEAIKVVMSLVLVLLIFYMGVTLFKKYLGGTYKGNASIRIIGGLSLGNKEKVVLVEAGSVNLLLGVSSAGVNKLHCFSENELSECVENEKAEVKSFNQHLKKFTGKV